jgi:uncharacterized Tic20 family protein
VIQLQLQFFYRDRYRQEVCHGESRVDADLGASKSRRDWFPIYSSTTKGQEIGKVELRLEYVNSEEEYLQKRLRECEQQISLQKNLETMLQNELAILNSIFEQTPNYIHPIISVLHDEKEARALSTLTKEEILRNYMCYLITLVAILISFQRADFLTLVFCGKLYSVLFVKWKNSDFLNFEMGLMIVFFYDVVWLAIIYPYLSARTKLTGISSEINTLFVVWLFSILNTIFKGILAIIMAYIYKRRNNSLIENQHY